MKKMIIHHTLSFKNAFRGIAWALRTQPHLIFHFFTALFVVVAGFYFRVSNLEWLALLVVIALVIVTELINTAVEIITDYLKLKKMTAQEDLFIMMAKDIGAAAVLLAAIFSVVIGFIIFGPRLINL